MADTKAKVLDKINAIQTQARVKPAADREVDNAYINVNKKSKIVTLQQQKKKKRHIRN